mmetsp:Transcript_9315/g.29069  ORF Transcript_9315/g.29069 Transcript_9315/m.29069 type:complete len:331 (+) Transcript_9315:107-1099(+)
METSSFDDRVAFFEGNSMGQHLPVQVDDACMMWSAGTAANVGAVPRPADLSNLDPSELPGVMEHELIGEGGFGKVYKCTVAGFPDRVALKVPKIAMSLEACREARILEKIDHPNIVKFHCTVGRGPFGLVMELCAGGTLHELLHVASKQWAAPVGLGPRLQAALDVVAAVAYIHALGIVHRDVKSTNALLSQPPDADSAEARLPCVKLSDMGLAKFATPDMMTNNIGTIAYMAPEVGADETYGSSADVYSCAILLHETASGEMPYGTSVADPRLVIDIMQGKRPPLDRLPPGPLGQELQALLEVSWSGEPEERITAAELAERLERLLPGR